MKATFQHVQFNVGDPDGSLPFYRDLFTFLGMKIIVEHPGELIGASDGATNFYFYRTDEDKRDYVYNRDASGMNHLGLHVETNEDVDRFIEDFLKPHSLEPQWGTPRSRPDYGGQYYQVMFEDPEGLAIEVYHSE
jgi:catechol 2,3-dioxygenase-like lactoylglutathione lyase family enzyme